MYCMQNNQYKTASYQAEFASYLTEKKYENTSVKSMGEDVSHFLSWAVKSARSSIVFFLQRRTLQSYLSVRALQQYFTFIKEHESPTRVKQLVKSIQIFIDFAVSKKWLGNQTKVAWNNLADQYLQMLSNQDKQITKFTQYLQLKGIAKNTLRSYLTDIREYLVIN